MQTFFIISNQEHIKMHQKKQSDEKEQQPKLKKRDLKDATKQLCGESDCGSSIPRPTSSSSFSSMLPVFSIIRNSIITPLLLAKERVVEYIVPEKQLLEEEKLCEETLLDKGITDLKLDDRPLDDRLEPGQRFERR